MKNILRALLALMCLYSTATAQVVELPYGQAFVLNFDLYNSTATDLKTDATCASGDVVIMKDQGSENNATNCFVDRGNGYSISLTAAELTASQTTIYIVDQSGPKVWLDKVVQVNLTKTVPSGTAQAGCTAPCATLQLATTASGTDDIYNNNFSLALVGGTGINQVRCISDYVGGTKTATVTSNWVTAPDATTQYMLLNTPNCNGSVPASGITSSTLDSTAITAITTDIFGKVYESEGSITFQEFLKYAGAVLFGRSDSNGLRFKTPNNNANRVTVTVDSNKNRTAITLNPS